MNTISEPLRLQRLSFLYAFYYILLNDYLTLQRITGIMYGD